LVVAAEVITVGEGTTDITVALVAAEVGWHGKVISQ